VDILHAEFQKAGIKSVRLGINASGGEGKDGDTLADSARLREIRALQ
jgi:hypothetical protein